MTLKEELKRAETALDPKEQDAIIAHIRATYQTPEEKKEISDYLVDLMDRVEVGIAEVRSEIDRLRVKKQLEDAYPLIPIGYIAENYFHKSRSWLSQRVNGSKVRGKVYTLNESEKAIFNDALRDIAHRIGSLTVV
ncbi:MAG: DUF5053 domain-containing protein [Mediterranea sp.]|jgi:hypothetical protein|nr:DUF5053 domain-containing protein [Mediterranea sp.]